MTKKVFVLSALLFLLAGCAKTPTGDAQSAAGAKSGPVADSASTAQSEVSENALTAEELSEFKYAVYPLKHEFKEGGDIVQTAESTYDEKDRLLKSVVTEGDRIYTDEYSYDEKGYLLKIISTDSAYPGEISYYEYTYDKKGNNTFRKVTDYDGSVSTTTIKYDKYGVWTEMEWVKTDGTVEHYTNT